MKINIEFLNGNNYWRERVLFSAEQASNALSDPDFLVDVRALSTFSYCADSPMTVADRLANIGEITVRVGFYRKWLTRAIAFEDRAGVHFNVCKERAGAGGPGDLAHEVMHVLGYSHNGNSPTGNQDTVPYWVGNHVEQFLKGKV